MAGQPRRGRFEQGVEDGKPAQLRLPNYFEKNAGAHGEREEEDL